MHVSIIDTSILCNILNIPARNQDHETVRKELEQLSKDKNQLLILPLASIIETGNHIAHISDGNIRRDRAALLGELIKKTILNQAPWHFYGNELDQQDLLKLADEWVEHATAGISLGDLSIIQVFFKVKENTLGIGSIRIWSLDKHLSNYNEVLVPPQRRRNL